MALPIGRFALGHPARRTSVGGVRSSTVIPSTIPAAPDGMLPRIAIKFTPEFSVHDVNDGAFSAPRAADMFTTRSARANLALPAAGSQYCLSAETRTGRLVEQIRTGSRLQQSA